MAGRAAKVSLTDRDTRALWNRRMEHPALSTDTNPQRFFYDAVVPGLNILWLPSGQLSWGMIKRWPSGSTHPTWRSLGTVFVTPKGHNAPQPAEQTTNDALTLSEARTKARRWLELLSRGIDPVQDERRRKTEAKERTTWPALRDAFLRYYEGKAKHGEAKRILEKDFAGWNDRFASEIDAADLEAAIQVILDRGAKYQALNAFGYVQRMYNWGIGKPSLGIKSSPCAGLSTRTLIGSPRPRTRVLTDNEIRAVWRACDEELCIRPFGQIVRLLLLTPLRENEIGRMRRDELDVDGKLLTIASARMKGDADDPPAPFEVPLTTAMIQIIDSIPMHSGGPFVFSTCAGRKPVTSWSKAKRRFDELSGVTGWRYHDLRRSVRTRISAIPAEEHVREALLAHGRRGIQAHYDQYRYRDEKRALLEAWQERLFEIVGGPTVVSQ
jgi:integrase